VLGQTQEALAQKAGIAQKARRQWDEAQLLAKLSERQGPEVTATAKTLVEWIRSNADRQSFNDAPSFGAVAAEFSVGGETVPFFKLWTDGNIQFFFSALARTKAYADSGERTELLQRIGDLSGAAFKHEAIDRLPSVKLSALSGDRCVKLTLVLDDVVRKLRTEAK
jgi:hypothetical protein